MKNLQIKPKLLQRKNRDLCQHFKFMKIFYPPLYAAATPWPILETLTKLNAFRNPHGSKDIPFATVFLFQIFERENIMLKIYSTIPRQTYFMKPNLIHQTDNDLTFEMQTHQFVFKYLSLFHLKLLFVTIKPTTTHHFFQVTSSYICQALRICVQTSRAK